MVVKLERFDVKKFIESENFETKVQNDSFGIPGILLNTDYEYIIDGEDLVVLPLWNVFVNRIFRNLSRDESITQPPIRTFKVLESYLTHYEGNSYFVKFLKGGSVPAVYVYHTKLRRELVLYINSNKVIYYMNQVKNATTSLVIPIQVDGSNSLVVPSGYDTRHDQMQTQVLISRLPLRIERYDLHVKPISSTDLDHFESLL